MKKSLTLTCLLTAGALFAAPASAATIVGNVALTDPNTTPLGTILCDFEGGDDCGLVGDYSIQNTTVGGAAQPFGNGSFFAAVPGTDDPSAGSAVLDLAALAASLVDPLTAISIDWGSVDRYNDLILTTTDGVNFFTTTINGNMVGPPANGDRDDAATNRRVTFRADAGQTFVSAEFVSLGRAFEFDTVTAAVPEPTTWMMLILGLFGVGGAMRRQKARQSASLAFS